MRILTTIILMLAFFSVFAAGKKNKTSDKKNETKTTILYMYGVSSSFNDSLVYITDVQPVENAYIYGKKFLGGAKEYAEQMNSYFTKKEQARRINAVFFEKTREKAEKSYVKLRKRYAKIGKEFTPIPTGDFVFQAVLPNE